MVEVTPKNIRLRKKVLNPSFCKRRVKDEWRRSLGSGRLGSGVGAGGRRWLKAAVRNGGLTPTSKARLEQLDRRG